MTRERVRLAVVVMASAVVVSVSHAQAPRRVAARHVRPNPIEVGRLISAPILDAPGSFTALRTDSTTAEILGVVQTPSGAPAPHAGIIVIRALSTGTAAGTTEVNGLAQFAIRSLRPGLYTAELVDRSGKVLVTSPAFTAAAGDLIQIAQTLPPSQDRLRETIQSATYRALTLAASSGVIALSPGAPTTPDS